MRNYLTTDIKSQTERALWEVWNVIDCVPDKLWSSVKNKITAYTNFLDDTQLVEKPVDCSHSKFELILRQFRHLHTHMGMIMGFIIEATGQWPTVLGLETPIPLDNNYSKYC